MNPMVSPQLEEKCDDSRVVVRQYEPGQSPVYESMDWQPTSADHLPAVNESAGYTRSIHWAHGYPSMWPHNGDVYAYWHGRAWKSTQPAVKYPQHQQWDSKHHHHTTPKPATPPRPYANFTPLHIERATTFLSNTDDDDEEEAAVFRKWRTSLESTRAAKLLQHTINSAGSLTTTTTTTAAHMKTPSKSRRSERRSKGKRTITPLPPPEEP